MNSQDEYTTTLRQLQTAIELHKTLYSRAMEEKARVDIENERLRELAKDTIRVIDMALAVSSMPEDARKISLNLIDRIRRVLVSDN